MQGDWRAVCRIDTADRLPVEAVFLDHPPIEVEAEAGALRHLDDDVLLDKGGPERVALKLLGVSVSRLLGGFRERLVVDASRDLAAVRAVVAVAGLAGQPTHRAIIGHLNRASYAV
jgi:hypothetical protein